MTPAFFFTHGCCVLNDRPSVHLIVTTKLNQGSGPQRKSTPVNAPSLLFFLVLLIRGC